MDPALLALFEGYQPPEERTFTRDPIDYSLFRPEEIPGWAYEYGTTGFTHMGLAPNYNELSPYVKATREMDNGLLAGIGRTINSEGADSVFAGIGGDYGPAWWELGLASGYEATPAMPFGRVGVGPVWAMPAYDGDNLGAVFGVNFLNREF